MRKRDDGNKNKNEGQYLIRDEELYQAFDEVRKKLGPKGHLLVIIDACHSGSALRGGYQLGARGTTTLTKP